jgi:hypothetical protein
MGGAASGALQVMNRWIWAARIFGIVVILMIVFMLSQMIAKQRQLQESQETSAPAR